MSDPFIRTRMLIGDEPLSRLAAAKVAVVVIAFAVVSILIVCYCQFLYTDERRRQRARDPQPSRQGLPYRQPSKESGAGTENGENDRFFLFIGTDFPCDHARIIKHIDIISPKRAAVNTLRPTLSDKI